MLPRNGFLLIDEEWKATLSLTDKQKKKAKAAKPTLPPPPPEWRTPVESFPAKPIQTNDLFSLWKQFEIQHLQATIPNTGR